MARARNIKPGFFTNDNLVELPFATRLLFIGLWTLADRRGVLEDRPKKIKMAIFPADDVNVEAALIELVGAGFIVRYKDGNTSLIKVLQFEKHQNPHKNEQASTFADYCEHGASTVQAQCEHGAAPADSLLLIPDSLIPDSLQELSPSDLSPAGADDQPTGDGKPSGKVAQLDSIPYQAVLDAYNAECSELFPEASKLTDKRRKAIKARWRADLTNPDERRRTNSLDYWRRYFAFCAGDITFFRKAAAGEHRGEHAGWKPTFDFLMREDTWLGVREGKYE